MTEEMAPYTVTSLPAGQKRGRKSSAKFVAITASAEGDLFALDNRGIVWESTRDADDINADWAPLPRHPEAAP